MQNLVKAYIVTVLKYDANWYFLQASVSMLTHNVDTDMSPSHQPRILFKIIYATFAERIQFCKSLHDEDEVNDKVNKSVGSSTPHMKRVDIFKKTFYKKFNDFRK